MEEKFNELIKMAKKDKELVAVALFGSSLYKKGKTESCYLKTMKNFMRFIQKQ